MIRSIAIALALFGAVFCSPADSFRPEGEPFHPDAPIAWANVPKGIPESFTVYKVVPQQFSKEVITRLIEIADFTPVTMKLSSDKKVMQWRGHEENGTLTRSLDISPSMGWVSFFNTKTEANGSKPAVGVPTFEEIDRLALDYLRQLGCDTNQLSLSPCSRTDHARSVYQKKGGTLLLEEFTMRGSMYCRKIDGIRFNGTSGRGGFWIEFGNNAKVARVQLTWRKLEPDKRFKTASAKEMIGFIKAGQATLPRGVDANGLLLAKKFTITKISPRYWGEVGGTEQKVAFPFAELEVKADFADSPSSVFTLFCPILSDKTVSEKN